MVLEGLDVVEALSTVVVVPPTPICFYHYQ